MNGVIYCIYNEMYGENVFKLGRTIHLNSRMKGYVTCYINPTIVKHTNNVSCIDKAENILFDKLKNYRIRKDREFFKCEFSIIEKAMNETATNVNGNIKKDNDKTYKYVCSICNKGYDRKSNYNSHLKRKIRCIPLKNENTQHINDENPMQCKYCKEIYSRKDSLKRHIEKRCKLKLKFDFEQLKQEINILKENNDKPTKEITNNNSKITQFGNEDLSFISDNDYEMIIKSDKPIITLIEHIHLNKNKPEYMNIHLRNLNNKYVYIFDGEKWRNTNKKEIFVNMYLKYIEILNPKLEKKYPMNIIENYIEDTKLVLYNGKTLIKYVNIYA